MGCKPAPACTKALKDATTRWPKRSRISDGICGDAAHATRQSDHNPDASGFAHAFDLTHDPINGVDGKIISRQVIHDPRMTYVIFAGEIFKARTGKWEPYRGPNRHDHHVHVSIKSTATKDLSPWPWSPEVAKPEPTEVDAPKPPDGAVTQVASNPPSTEVKPSGMSLPTKIAAAAGPVGTAATALGIKIGNIAITQNTIYALAFIAVAAIVCSTIIYITGKNREWERQKLSMMNLADPNRGNVVAGK